jgi:hypothetical protein
MEELIKQAFLNDSDIGTQVQNGAYDLVGPDGGIILPQIWETMVRPDWDISMHMLPMKPPALPEFLPPPPILYASRGRKKIAKPKRRQFSTIPPPQPPLELLLLPVLYPPSTIGSDKVETRLWRRRSKRVNG